MTTNELYKGYDLENWRIKNNFRVYEACEMFGLNHAKWKMLTKKGENEVIADKTISYLLKIFELYPESNPINHQLSIKEFYYSLGFRDIPADRKEFAKLVGRSVFSSYRFTTQNNTSKTVIKWLEAIQRLDDTKEGQLKIMNEIASSMNKKI